MSVCLLNIMSVQSYAIHTRNIPTRSSRISMEEVNQSPKLGCCPVAAGGVGTWRQCQSVPWRAEYIWNISTQHFVTTTSGYMWQLLPAHCTAQCTPHCNNARVPQFGLDNVINCWQATWLAKILKTVRQLQTSTEHPNFKCRPTSLSVKALAGAFSKHSVVVTISMLKLRNPIFCTACAAPTHSLHLPTSWDQGECCLV